MVSPERIEALQRQWVVLLGAFEVAPAEAYPLFDQLVETYSEPHRHYHTLEHIAEMLKVVGKLADQCEEVRTVQLAVWFHDAVYDPTAKDNEARSADFAERELAKLSIPDTVIQAVATLVRATAHSPNVSRADGNTAVLLDADLAILGSGEDRYRRYAEAIRREYAHVPEESYRQGRVAVLNLFLERERVYLTERMATEGEAAARRNMQAEIESFR